MRKTIVTALLCIAALRLCGSPVFASLNWDASIKIYAPEYSYEGHSFNVYDNSLFHLGSTVDEHSFRNAETASREGCIASKWEGDYLSLPGSVWLNGNCLSQDIVFNEPGLHTITLSTTWTAGDHIGKTNTAAAAVDIRPCPYVASAELGGEQRACQRQTLLVSLAHHPEHRLIEESVSVRVYDEDGRLLSFCRPLRKLSDDGRFAVYELEFLTKNKTKASFRYEISASDSRGKSVSHSNDFEVAEDKAPELMIRAAGKYYRGNGGSPALINAGASVRSDDPVSYSWSCTKLRNGAPEKLLSSSGEFSDIAGTENLSGADSFVIGTGTECSFSVPSVGHYALKLSCRDIPQGSLSEFLNEEDIKTAEYTKSFKIDNLAPVFGKPVYMKSLELLLVNPDFGDGSITNPGDSRLPEKLAELSEKLLEKGLRADIHSVFLDTAEQAGELSLLGALTLPYHMNNSIANSFFEACTACDDKYIYKLLPSSELVRCELKDLGSRASFTVPLDGYGLYQLHPFIGTDNLSRYCYVILTQNRKEARSLIIDNETGETVLTLGRQLGKFNYVDGDDIYSVCPEGVFKINISNGSCTKLLAADCLQNDGNSARLYHRDIIFVAKEDGKLMLHRMKLPRPGAEILFTKTELGPSAEALLGCASSSDHLLNISPSGKILIASQGGAKTVQTTKLTVRAWDINGEMLYESFSTAPLVKTRVNLPAAFPVYSAAGEAPQIALPTAIRTDFSIIDLATREAQPASYDIAAGMSYMKRHNDIFVLGTSSISSIAQNGKALINIYRYSEGYPNNPNRRAMELLSFESDYSIQTGIADAEHIAAECGISTNQSGYSFPKPDYNIGDSLRLSDFGLSPACFSDIENDVPLIEHCSMDIDRSLNTPGHYSFKYWVSDSPGDSEFERSSKKLTLYFSVAQKNGEGETPGEGGWGSVDPEELKEPGAAAPGKEKLYRLHRRY